jgi:iron complex transport system permease protein
MEKQVESIPLSGEKRYQAFERKRKYLGWGLVLLLLFSGILALSQGAFPVSFHDFLGSVVIWNIRLPRILSALLVGGILGVSGTVMQTVLRNPLASPFTLGISSGAAFGAAMAIVFLGSGQLQRTGITGVVIHHPYVVPLFAFIFSLMAVGMILTLVKLRNVTPTAMILAGVAMSSFFQASTMLIQLFSEDVKVAAVVFWTFGDVGRTNWTEIAILGIGFLIIFSLFLSMRWQFNAMLSGDETAKSLGIDPEKLRLRSMVLASLLTSLSVSFAGIIAFIGLMAPHLVRLLIGGDHRHLIPYSVLMGSLLLLLSDTLGRTILSPTLIPVGIITSFVGVPMLLYLLIKGQRDV